MSSLAAATGLSFTELRDVLKMTDGNVTAHVRALQQAGYVAITKTTQNGRNLTTFSLTKSGAAAFRNYISLLEQIVQETRNQPQQGV